MSERPQAQLHFRRTLEAPRQRVFELWTEPEHIKRWFGGLEVEVERVELDLRPGGSYSIAVKAEEGLSVFTGEFVTVEVPSRLVYTWRTEGGPSDSPTTTVEVTFTARGDQTEVELTHAGFVEPQVRELHAQGWEACFTALASLL